MFVYLHKKQTKLQPMFLESRRWKFSQIDKLQPVCYIPFKYKQIISSKLISGNTTVIKSKKDHSQGRTENFTI